MIFVGWPRTALLKKELTMSTHRHSTLNCFNIIGWSTSGFFSPKNTPLGLLKLWLLDVGCCFFLRVAGGGGLKKSSPHPLNLLPNPPKHGRRSPSPRPIRFQRIRLLIEQRVVVWSMGKAATSFVPLEKDEGEVFCRCEVGCFFVFFWGSWMLDEFVCEEIWWFFIKEDNC